MSEMSCGESGLSELKASDPKREEIQPSPYGTSQGSESTPTSPPEPTVKQDGEANPLPTCGKPGLIELSVSDIEEEKIPTSHDPQVYLGPFGTSQGEESVPSAEPEPTVQQDGEANPVPIEGRFNE